MTGATPMVSIGLPVYNGENFVSDAIQCVLAQTYTDWELVISDNASTDRTLSICRGFSDKDRRIRVYANCRNMGVSLNHNRVFQLSCGQYFKWMAHDDLFGAEFIQTCVSELANDDRAVLAFPRMVHIDTTGRPLRRQDGRLSVSGSTAESRVIELMQLEAEGPDIFWLQFGLIRRSALEQTRLMDLYSGSDQVLLLELVLQGAFKQVDKELFFRREHPAASTLRRGWSAKERAVFVYPDDRRMIVFPYCRLFEEHFASIRHSAMPTRSKIQCSAAISRRFLTQWKYFLHEIFESPLELWRAKEPSIDRVAREQNRFS
jgi:glycosyltransferase involved in cell wall biosynthesis